MAPVSLKLSEVSVFAGNQNMILVRVLTLAASSWTAVFME